MFMIAGLLVLFAVGGVLAGAVSLLFKGTRFLSAYFFIAPPCAAFLSFWLLWGGGFLVERLFGPTRWSTLGAFLGLTGGFAIGGAFGLYVAAWINRRLEARGALKRAEP